MFLRRSFEKTFPVFAAAIFRLVSFECAYLFLFFAGFMQLNILANSNPSVWSNARVSKHDTDLLTLLVNEKEEDILVTNNIDDFTHAFT